MNGRAIRQAQASALIFSSSGPSYRETHLVDGRACGLKRWSGFPLSSSGDDGGSERASERQS